MIQRYGALQLQNVCYQQTEDYESNRGAKRNSQEQEEKDTTCGIGSCKPKWMQRFIHPVPFLIVYSLLGMVQGLLWSYYVGAFTTLERRFSYTSKVTAFISISDNIGIIVASILIGYFGGKGHRPRWVAAGMIIAACGALISASPYWIFGPNTHQTISTQPTEHNLFPSDLCVTSHNESDYCELKKSQLSETLPAVSLIVAGNIINGMGLTAFYVVGTPYLDDNIKKSMIPLYFGVMYAVRLFGPALGFFLASATLQLYENPFAHPHFNGNDPRWIGAWWLGFVIIAGILNIFSLILYCFPKRLKWNNEEAAENAISVPTMTDSAKSAVDRLKDLLFTVFILLKNKTLMFRFTGESLNLLGTLGFVLFTPKYLESQFKQAASEASKMAGMAGTMFMVVGFCLSAVIMWKFKPSPRAVAIWIVIAAVVNAGVLLAAGSIECNNQEVVTASCQDDCKCSFMQFSPVCYNNVTYFSSCFVGCTSSFETSNHTKVYTNCSCADSPKEEIVSGFCPSSCNIILYLILIVISNLFSSSAKVGGLLITLRCVDTSHQKSVALAILSVMLCFVAFIPCPFLYGSLVDSACKIWRTSCGETGNCWVYDNDKFRYLLHGLSALFILLGSVADSFVCHFCKTIKSLYDDAEADQIQQVQQPLPKLNGTHT